ncbi:flagellar biosynthesis protein FlgE [Celerinatantimonas sp. MCCC 1A17872]|uniref:flagellar biosynthesis protein FlgE n=1 Tax=Celerinatantimonas sp. MCCC 1A17872 TaxID=3177514 RepID=UPI0038C3D807
MEIQNASTSGMQMIRRADQQVSQSSHDLARVAAKQPPQPGDRSVTDAMIGLKQGEIYAKTGAKVIQTHDQMVGSLLDIQA